MIFPTKIQPLFNVPDSGGASPPGPPAEPPTNPTDPNPDAVSQEDSWVLGHFEALQADEAGEDLDSSITGDAAPEGDPPQVSVQAEKPEGAIPSEQTGKTPGTEGAIATPPQGIPVVNSPAPQVGNGAQPVAGQGTAQPPPDPTQIWALMAKGMAEKRAEFIGKLAERHVLPEKELEELGFTPEQGKFLANLVARAQFEATSSVTQMQAEQLPVYLNSMLEARVANQRKEDEFFGKFPQLKAAPRDQLGQVFQAVSQLHPNLKGDAWAKKAGEMACISLGLPLQVESQPAVTANNQQVRTPGPIVRRTNGVGHIPVGTSTAPGPAVPQKSEIETFFDLLQRTDAGEFEG